jgi:hypothetical protein
LTDAPGQALDSAKTAVPAAVASETTPAETFSPNKMYTITPGKGLDIISVGDSAEQVETVFGKPTERNEFNSSYKLAYDDASIDFILNKQSNRITEIHFNEGFRGRLAKGVRMGGSLEQVVAQTGPVKKRVNASPEEARDMQMGSDRVLYTQRMGREITAYKLADSDQGANYWFDADKKLVQVVVYPARSDERLRENQLPEGSLIDEHGHIVDRVDWPFVNDPAILGKWESVDFVKEIKDFDLDKPSGRKLFLKGMVFEEDGRANYGFSHWTKGKVIHVPDKTAAEYVIKEMNGRQYLFLEWKTGDYTIRHRKPWYYVLSKLPADSPKLANARELLAPDPERPQAQPGPDSHSDEQGHIVDKVDYPFVSDPDVIGTWTSVDFVDKKDQFDPAKRNWKGDLFLKEVVFEPGGKVGPRGSATWTKGLVLHRGDQTACAYEIVEKDGEKYMLLEWKSGDYKVLHRKPSYYALKKAAAN